MKCRVNCKDSQEKGQSFTRYEMFSEERKVWLDEDGETEEFKSIDGTEIWTPNDKITCAHCKVPVVSGPLKLFKLSSGAMMTIQEVLVYADCKEHALALVLADESVFFNELGAEIEEVEVKVGLVGGYSWDQ